MDKAYQQFRLLTNESIKQSKILHNEFQKKRKLDEDIFRKEDKQRKRDGIKKSQNEKCFMKDKPNKRLEAGKVLPHYLGDYFSKKEFSGKILEDIDPFYNDKRTFIVIDRSKTIYRFSSTKAFFILTPFNPFRTMAIKILIHPSFNFCMLLTIFVNCLLMIQLDSDQVEVSQTDLIEGIFTIIYMTEFLIKVLSRGFVIGQFTYLMDIWNWLDIIVLGLAYFMHLNPNLGKFSGLRSLRVLRALKTITAIPGMKTVVNSLLMAIIKLRDAIVLTFFMLSIFALIGLQLYRGTLLKKCVQDFHNNSTENVSWADKMMFFNENKNWQYPITFCHNLSSLKWNSTCQSGYVCIKTDAENPNFNYTSFDNFGMSLLCSFRLMTQDFWEDLYRLIIRTNGDAHMIYFMIVIFFGSFYLVNVILSIVAMSYDDVRKSNIADSETEEAEKKIEEDKREKLLEIIDQEAKFENIDKVVCKSENALFNIEDMNKSFNYWTRKQIIPIQIRRTKSLNWNVKLKPRLELHDNRQETYRKSKPFDLTNDILTNTNTSLYVIKNYSTLQCPEIRVTLENDHDCNVSEKYTTLQSNVTNVTEFPFHSIRTDLSVPRIEKTNSKNDFSFRGFHLSDFTKEEILPRYSEMKESDLIKSLSVLNIFENENKLKKKDLYILRLRKTFCNWDCCPAYNYLKESVAIISLDPFMELFVTICIILNTVFMAIDTYDITKPWDQILAKANFFFMAIFTIEACMKLITLGPHLYFSEYWNVFDFLIVILTSTEVIAYRNTETSNKGIMSLLRTFRLLQIFKLAKSWQTMNLLFTIIGRTLGAIGNLCIVLGIIIFIFAVVGMQIFGKSYHKFTDKIAFPDKKGIIPRWNFCDFFHSFMIVFRVLCGEYMESMWDCMRVNGYYCIPFFLATMILGKLVILNLFLALLLSAFSSESLQRREDESEDINKLHEALIRIYLKLFWIKSSVYSMYYGVCKNIMEVIRRYINSPSHLNQTGHMLISNSEAINIKNHYFSENGSYCSELDLDKLAFNLWKENYHPRFDSDPEIHEANIIYSAEPDNCLPKRLRKFLSKFSIFNNETDFMKIWLKIRRVSHKIISHKYFESFILIMIVISSLTMTLEDKNLPKYKKLEFTLKTLDKIFTVIFLIEMILKWLAIGLTKYFKDVWCWIDFIIVLVAIISLSFESINGSSLKVLRTIRALKPLRAISRWEGMKIVVDALIFAIPSIFNVLLVCLVFWLIFSIIGMQMFGGKFFKCVDSNLQQVNLSNRNMCEEYQKVYKNVSWENSKINFDNVLNGYLSLFQIATFKGWTDIMADAIDITEVGKQPVYENNYSSNIFFVIFITFGSFFTLNLFVGVIIDNFNIQKKKIGGSVELFLTESQKRYYNAMKKISNIKPQKPIPKPKSQIALIFYKIISNQKFDIVIMCFIMLNTIVMCLETHKQEQELTDALDLMNKVFVLFFTVECLIKLIAWRWYYFKIPWNIFDFVIVLLSITFWIVERLINFNTISPTFIRVIRVFRIGRVLRLVKSARGIRTLLFSLIISLPALFNIGLLLMLVMFIYAIIGVSLFMDVAYSGGIDATFNFETFGKAIIILFQISTSGGWNTILEGLMNNDTTECKKENRRNKCGNYIYAVLYIVSYLVITFLIIVNMYIAVILENFNQATKDVQQGLTQDDYDLFYEFWEEYDPAATGFIPLKHLTEFVAKIGSPLGIPLPNKFLLTHLEIPIYNGDTVCCVDLLDKLTKNFLGEYTEPDTIIDLKSKSKTETKINNKKIVISNTLYRQREEWAARKIVYFLHDVINLKKINHN